MEATLTITRNTANCLPATGRARVSGVRTHLDFAPTQATASAAALRKSTVTRRTRRIMEQNVQKRGVVTRIADAIRAKWGSAGKPSAEAARALKIPKRTIDAWLEERQAPRAEQLIRLMQESDEVFGAVCELAGRTPPPSLSSAERAAINSALAKLTGET